MQNNMESIKGKKVCVGVTGGIAVYKACEVVSGLRKLGADVTIEDMNYDDCVRKAAELSAKTPASAPMPPCSVGAPKAERSRCISAMQVW